MQGAAVLLDPRGNALYVSELPTGAHQDYMTALPVYGFTPRVLDYLDKMPVAEQSGERALTAAIQLIIDDGGVVGALESSWNIRLDEPDDLLTANAVLMAEYPSPVLQSAIPESVEITPPVHIDPGVKVGSGARIGPNVYLESGSIIGADATVSDAAVLGAQIGMGQHVEHQIIIEERP
jgi:bifunctional UDP-N-acetylglucosamine pyrophosphorylase/glucosamine-1-phosphate N-acetyltransferase